MYEEFFLSSFFFFAVFGFGVFHNEVDLNHRCYK